MQKKTAILLGAAFSVVIILLAIIGTVTVKMTPSVLEWGKKQIDMEKERRALADGWQPPGEEAPRDNFFPDRVNGYELEAEDDKAVIPEFYFDLSGMHAIYRSNVSRIDVYVYRATELEKEALFGRVNRVYEKQAGGVKIKTEMGYRMYYSSSQHHQNHFWWIKGWLLVFRTDDNEDREPFVKRFLQVTSS